MSNVGWVLERVEEWGRMGMMDGARQRRRSRNATYGDLVSGLPLNERGVPVDVDTRFDPWYDRIQSVAGKVRGVLSVCSEGVELVNNLLRRGEISNLQVERATGRGGSVPLVTGVPEEEQIGQVVEQRERPEVIDPGRYKQVELPGLE
jgi:hypothetical protein